jgi:hypothetical protein
MKYIKMLGLLAVAAAALMAFAGSASATTVTSPTGTVYNGVIEATGSTTYLTGTWSAVECKHSEVKGEITTQGDGITAEGPITTLHFSQCNYPTTVIKSGSLVAHTDTASADYNGTLTSVGAEVLVHTSIGTCRFSTGTGTDIGTLTGGAPAKLAINSAKIPVTEGNFFCGNSGIWEGSYTVTNPTSLYID